MPYRLAHARAGEKAGPLQPPGEGPEAQWPREAKISGRAVVAGPGPERLDGDRFRADVADVVHTHRHAEATMPVVGWWSPTNGLQRIERG